MDVGTSDVVECYIDTEITLVRRAGSLREAVHSDRHGFRLAYNSRVSVAGKRQLGSRAEVWGRLILVPRKEITNTKVMLK
jgi:hypothetical protein